VAGVVRAGVCRARLGHAGVPVAEVVARFHQDAGGDSRKQVQLARVGGPLAALQQPERHVLRLDEVAALQAIWAADRGCGGLWRCRERGVVVDQQVLLVWSELVERVGGEEMKRCGLIDRGQPDDLGGQRTTRLSGWVSS